MSYELTDDLLADIRNLFISRAAFLAGSKPKQSGVDVSLLKLMINNAAGNGFAFEVSDDSKQMLLAGNESVSGAKTWLAAAIFQAAVTMNAAVAINAALTLAGNILANKYSLNEITTPTAVADKGAVYTKSDNKLYFQDGAGVEHEMVSQNGGNLFVNGSLICSAETDIGLGGSTYPGTTITSTDEFYCTVAPTQVTEKHYTMADGVTNGQIMIIRNTGSYLAQIDNIWDGTLDYIELAAQEPMIIRWSVLEDVWIWIV